MPVEYRTISGRVPVEDAQAFAEQARRLRLSTSKAIGLLVQSALLAEYQLAAAEREAAGEQAERLPWTIGRG